MKVSIDFSDLKEGNEYVLEMTKTSNGDVSLKFFKNGELLTYTTEDREEFCKAVELVTGSDFQ